MSHNDLQPVERSGGTETSVIKKIDSQVYLQKEKEVRTFRFRIDKKFRVKCTREGT